MTGALKKLLVMLWPKLYPVLMEGNTGQLESGNARSAAGAAY
jgi:hypothetical protein